MKFRKKPVIVDAVQYIKGMEDGFTESLESGLDVPYIQNKNDAIMYLISDGDWILTENGRKRVCSNVMFHEKYEPTDEYWDEHTENEENQPTKEDIRNL